MLGEEDAAAETVAAEVFGHAVAVWGLGLEEMVCWGVIVGIWKREMRRGRTGCVRGLGR